MRFSLNKRDLLHTAEALVSVFVVASLTSWETSNYSFAKLAVLAALKAGGSALVFALIRFISAN